VVILGGLFNVVIGVNIFKLMRYLGVVPMEVVNSVA
jgi:hypothetical protein